MKTHRFFAGAMALLTVGLIFLSFGALQVNFDPLMILRVFPWMAFPFTLGMVMGNSGQKLTVASVIYFNPGTEEETTLENEGVVYLDGVITDIKTHISVPSSMSNGGKLLANYVDTKGYQEAIVDPMLDQEFEQEDGYVEHAHDLPDYFLISEGGHTYTRHRSLYHEVEKGQPLRHLVSMNDLTSGDETNSIDVIIYVLITIMVGCYNHRGSQSSDMRHSRVVMLAQDNEDLRHYWFPEVDGRLYNIRVQIMAVSNDVDFDSIHAFGVQSVYGNQYADGGAELDYESASDQTLLTPFTLDAASTQNIWTNFRSGPFFVRQGDQVQSMCDVGESTLMFVVEAIFVPDWNAEFSAGAVVLDVDNPTGMMKWRLPFDMFLQTIEVELSGYASAAGVASGASLYVFAIRGARDDGNYTSSLNTSLADDIIDSGNPRYSLLTVHASSGDNIVSGEVGQYHAKDSAYVGQLYHAGDILWFYIDTKGEDLENNDLTVDITGRSRVKSTYRGIDELSGDLVNSPYSVVDR